MTILHFKVLYSSPCTNRSGSHIGGPYKTHLKLEFRYKHTKKTYQKNCIKWVDRLMAKKFFVWGNGVVCGEWACVYACVCLHAAIAVPTLSVQKRSKFPQILLPLNETNCHIHVRESMYKIFRLRLRSGFFLFFWWEVQSSRHFVTETRQWLLESVREREREIDRACILTQAKSMQILSLGPCTLTFFFKWQNTKQTLLVKGGWPAASITFALSFFPYGL